MRNTDLKLAHFAVRGACIGDRKTTAADDGEGLTPGRPNEEPV
jgi:hypothetical protein